METVTDFIFLGSKITADGDCSHEIKKHLLLGRKVITNLDSVLKSRDITLPTKIHLVKAIVFPVVMYRCELNHKESWVSKNWCFWTVVLEKTLGSPLDCKEIQPVFPKDWCWSWDSNTLVTWCEVLTPWKRLLGKDAGKDWRQEEKGMTDDEMIGWHHHLNGHALEQAPWEGVGQGSLTYYSTWGHKMSNTTELLNWTYG